jgi:transposase
MEKRRHELTDEQWERIKPLLPPQKPPIGRPAKDHRLIINGILWILKTGAPWRDLPERYGSWRTVYSRFYRWSKNGIWERIFSALQQRIDAEGGMDWDLHLVDGTVVRAHRHAAGAKRGIQRPRPSGEAEGDSARKCICESTAIAT